LGPGYPALAGWLVERARPAVEALRSRARRESLASRIAVLMRAGDLPGLLAALDDEEARRADGREAARVAARQAAIEVEIAALVAARGSRRAWARATALEAVQAAAAGGIIMALAMTLS
jgi:hypothetical protein